MTSKITLLIGTPDSLCGCNESWLGRIGYPTDGTHLIASRPGSALYVVKVGKFRSTQRANADRLFSPAYEGV